MDKRYNQESLLDVGKSLMVIHGAGLVVLVSLLGDAAGLPKLLDFIAGPAISTAVGLGASMYGYAIARFDPPPEGSAAAHGYLWLFMAASAFAFAVAILTGFQGFFNLY